jgi:hypothetical protein
MVEADRRILRELARGGRLEPVGEGWCLTGEREVLPTALVKRLAAQGLIRADGDGFVAAGGSAGDDRFADQHRLLTTRLIKDDRGRDCYVVVNAAESPLALLYRRGFVDAVQFDAGEKLRRDFTLAQLTPRLGVNYSLVSGRRSGRSEIVETALAARQRFNRALTEAGPGLADVLFDVCCYLRGLEECERTRRWPRGSSRIVLRIALDRLADHYGMRARRKTAIRSWSSEEEGP